MSVAAWPTYDRYKDSGIDWICQIPAHWEVRRNFALFREMKVSGRADLPVLSVSIHSGVSSEELSDEENIRSIIKIEDRTTYKEVKPGDVAYNMMRAWQGGIGAVSVHGMVSPAYVVARPSSALVADYFELLYRCPAFIRQMDSGSKGITDFRKRLYWDDFKNLLTLVPPRNEQLAIVQHIAEVSEKIDEAVRIKEAQIALLRERRQILIQETITRGLNPDAPMKDSGIDWIGQIPAHWEVKRLKHIALIRYGLGQPPRETEDGLPLLRATNVERGKINPKGLIFVAPAGVPRDRNAFLKQGEIIVVRSGAYTGDSAIVPIEFDGAVAGYDMVVTPHGVNEAFLSLSLLCPYILYEQLYLLRMRSAQPHLNKEELGETIVLLPPGDEQSAIVNDIKANCEKIDNGITIKQGQITALKEYKTVLINATVTGKIKVI
ncbi:restriction endonuclease subunit S [Allochromatium humboldtianum]|uniref:Restriction endonuclease subunit S n=1 Tax=Allochromatium humboldtianum TaxID=504901 RepID=A0A850RCP6_9GAMM|nr:restriction endonuclease subunit S [Allochromatium humboldtianum]NVZ10026.1 restriction endonuclease subunit S [Allochromatium humboldtianum]